MSERRYQVKEVARLSGVTVRTLHHYDRIGLLAPSGRTDAGYRLYDEADLLRLQRILLHRELGLSLEEIGRVLDDPGTDPRESLLAARARLRVRADELAAMLRAVDAALAAMEGGGEMVAEEIFEGFDPSRYEDEARARWGGTPAWAEASRRTAGYGDADWAELRAEAAGILSRLAEAMGEGVAPTSPAAAGLAELHREHLDRWFYPCDCAMHEALAGMYQGDPRFRATFEEVAEGLTDYLAAAIRANAARA